MNLDLRPTPVVKKLMIGLISIWLVFSFLINFVEQSWAADLFVALSLEPQEALFGGKVWQVLTYSLLHDLSSPSHVIFNAIGLLFLAPPLERRWGSRGFLQFAIFSALIAGVFSLLCGLIAPGLFGARVVGVSGVVMAVLAAFSFVMPNATILLFFVIPVQARWIVWLALGIDAMMFLSSPQGSGLAFHTHLGGVLAAWLLITGNWRPSLLKDRFHLFTLKKKRRPPKLKIVKGGRDDRDMLN
ncbi:MAG: rhomboid family intramembrane serine protease [Myxococcota bacterium]